MVPTSASRTGLEVVSGLAKVNHTCQKWLLHDTCTYVIMVARCSKVPQSHPSQPWVVLMPQLIHQENLNSLTVACKPLEPIWLQKMISWFWFCFILKTPMWRNVLNRDYQLLAHHANLQSEQ